jgi:hypothetical protein
VKIGQNTDSFRPREPWRSVGSKGLTCTHGKRRRDVGRAWFCLCTYFLTVENIRRERTFGLLGIIFDGQVLLGLIGRQGGAEWPALMLGHVCELVIESGRAIVLYFLARCFQLKPFL